MGGPSDTEVTLMHAQARLALNEIQQQQTQFAESQALYQFLEPQLQNMIQNPTGFSAQELADLNATNVNTTGAQYANVQKQVNLRNANENMAGLTSGVAAGESTMLQSAAAGQVAQGATNIQMANAELAQQKQQAATQEMLALHSGQGQMAIGIGNTENTAQANAFNQANQVNQQQDALTNSLIGAGLGIGMTALTGGLSGMMTGGSFMSGAGNALSGGYGGF